MKQDKTGNETQLKDNLQVNPNTAKHIQINAREIQINSYSLFLFITICDAVSNKTPVSDSTIVPLRESFSATHYGKCPSLRRILLLC